MKPNQIKIPRATVKWKKYSVNISPTVINMQLLNNGQKKAPRGQGIGRS